MTYPYFIFIFKVLLSMGDPTSRFPVYELSQVYLRMKPEFGLRVSIQQAALMNDPCARSMMAKQATLHVAA